MQITVLNKRTLSDPLPGVTRVYVGRPSVLGNPFAIGRDGDRDTVVAKYRRWLYSQLRGVRTGDAAVRRAVHDLLAKARTGPLELVCWCAPAPCHADVLRSALLWLDEHYRANRE